VTLIYSGRKPLAGMPVDVPICRSPPYLAGQTVVHFQMVAIDKRAMRRPANKAYHAALAELHAGDGDGRKAG
jgi:hypothetical protein